MFFLFGRALRTEKLCEACLESSWGGGEGRCALAASPEADQITASEQ